MLQQLKHAILSKMTAAGTAAVITASCCSVHAFAADSAATFRQRVLEAWAECSDSISVQDLRMTVDECIEIYYDLLYSGSNYFYISSSLTYSQSFNGNVVKIGVKFNYDKEDIPEMIEVFDAEVSRIVGMCDDSWSDTDKVLFFHDYLAANCQYDETLVYGDAYAALITGTAVCQGYSLAMNVLCEEAGITCCAITSDSQMHMWNLVKLDGNWYHLDITYDDPSPDIIGQASHDYVLRSDAYMMADDGHAADDWETFAGETVECTDDSYDDAFWNGAIDAVTPLADGSFLINMQVPPMSVTSADEIGASILRVVKDENGNYQASPLYTYQTYWETPDGNIYRNCYSYAEVYGDRIYYTASDRIYSISLNGDEQETFYTLTAQEKALGAIYGMTIDENGLLTYQLMAQPGYSEDSQTLDITYHTIQLEQPAEITTTSQTTTSTTTTTTTTTTTLPETTTSTIVSIIYTSIGTTQSSTSTSTTTTTTSKPTTTTTTTTSKPTTTTTTTTSKPTTTTTTTTSKPTTTTTTTTSKPTTTTTTTTFKSTTTTTTTTSKPTTTTTTTTSKPTTTTTTTTSKPTTTTTTTTSTSTTTISTTTTPKTTASTTTSSDPTTSATTETTVITPTLRGDATVDQEIDISDVILIARVAAEDDTVSISNQGKCNADYNLDGIINALDATFVLKVIAKLIE